MFNSKSVGIKNFAVVHKILKQSVKLLKLMQPSDNDKEAISYCPECTRPRRDFKYLSYGLRHKYFVFCECRKLGITYRGLVHDLSKLLPSEFFPYGAWFFGPFGTKFNGGYAWEHSQHGKANRSFDMAWLKHQNRNPHHWEYWCQTADGGKCICINIPEVYLKEMVADWIGTGKAKGKGNDLKEWYAAARQMIMLSPSSRLWVEKFISEYNSS